jgi:hypothetical protein
MFDGDSLSELFVQCFIVSQRPDFTADIHKIQNNRLQIELKSTQKYNMQLL